MPEHVSIGSRIGKAIHPLVRWEGALVLMLIAVLVLGSQLSTAFWKSDNIFYIGLNIGEIAIMALPLALIVITGEIDLSVASMLGLAGTVMATLFAHGWSIWPAMAAALLVGAAGGLFNGLLVTRVGLPSLAVTIGTLTLFRGIAQIILPNNTVGGFPESLTKIGIVPVPGTRDPVLDPLLRRAGRRRGSPLACDTRRPRDLRNRGEQGGSLLLGDPSQADQAAALRRLGDAGSVRRNPLDAPLRIRPLRRRDGSRAATS